MIYKYKRWPRYLIMLLLCTSLFTSCLESLDPQLTPVISNLSPNVISQGATFTIEGTNFSFLNTATSVYLIIEGEEKRFEIEPSIETNPATRLNTISVNTSQDQPAVDANGTISYEKLGSGNYTIYLLVKDRENDRSSNRVDLTIEKFEVLRFEPEQAKEGEMITIHGSGLDETEAVIFQGMEYQMIEANLAEPPTKQQVKVRVPAGAVPGVVQLKMKFNASPVATLPFKVILPPPVIHSFSPTQAAAGLVVTISGQNLGHRDVFAREVFFTGKSGQWVSADFSPGSGLQASTEEVSVVVPSGAADGPIKIVVEGQEVISQQNFIVEQILASTTLLWANYDAIRAIFIDESGTPRATEFYKNPDIQGYQSAAFDPVTNRIYFLGEDPATYTSSVYSINTDGDDLRKLHEGNAERGLLKVRYGGGYVFTYEVLYADYRMEIWRMNPDGSERTLLADVGDSMYSSITVSNDGTYMYAFDPATDPFVKGIALDGSGTVTGLYGSANVQGGFTYLDGSSFGVLDNKLYVSLSNMQYNSSLYVTTLGTAANLVEQPNVGGATSVVTSFALDATHKKLYWLEYNYGNSTTTMYRSNSDFTETEELFTADEVNYVLPDYQGFVVF